MTEIENLREELRKAQDPIKPPIPSVTSRSFERLAKLEEENAKLRDIIQRLGNKENGGCWCEVGIGNPMVSSHSKVCEDALNALDAGDSK